MRSGSGGRGHDLPGLLPPAFAVLVTRAIGGRAWRLRGEIITRREAALYAFLAAGGLVALGTEALSLARALNLPGVLSTWSVATALAGLAVFRQRWAVVDRPAPRRGSRLAPDPRRP